ncbi:MAG: 50S ribosomal protein L24 [Desulfovibrio sp.]|nr:50S ribosomal protein L24 [Desulfovibrio sp.]
MSNIRIRKDDKVMVITGRDAGKIGQVLRILKKHNTVLVKDVNKCKRHVSSKKTQDQVGTIITKEMPIALSNVMVICSACGKTTRIGYKFIERNGKQTKVRFCKKCNEVM